MQSTIKGISSPCHREPQVCFSCSSSFFPHQRPALYPPRNGTSLLISAHLAHLSVQTQIIQPMLKAEDHPATYPGRPSPAGIVNGHNYLSCIQRRITSSEGSSSSQ